METQSAKAQTFENLKVRMILLDEIIFRLVHFEISENFDLIRRKRLQS